MAEPLAYAEDDLRNLSQSQELSFWVQGGEASPLG